MAWIESHQEIARHPKTRRAARALGVSLPTMIGHLHLLWWWALDFADDGDLSSYEPIEISEAAMWEGEPEQFVSALRSAGFVDNAESDLSLHDWDEYAGKLVDQRKANAERQRRYRVKQRNEDESEVSPARNGNITVMSPQRHSATVPDRTGPDLESVSHETAAADPPDEPEVLAAHAAPPVGGVFESFQNRLKAEKNRGPVLADAMVSLFGDGYPPKIPRLQTLARDLGGAGELLRLMFVTAPDWRGVDDPHDFLAGAVRKRKAGKRPEEPPKELQPWTSAEDQAERDRLKVAEFLARTQSPPWPQMRTNGKSSGP